MPVVSDEEAFESWKLTPQKSPLPLRCDWAEMQPVTFCFQKQHDDRSDPGWKTRLPVALGQTGEG